MPRRPLALLGLLLSLPAYATPRTATPMLPEKTRAQPFTLPDRKGRSVSLSHFLHKKRIVLLFVPPQAEAQGQAYLAHVNAEREQYMERDLAVLAVVSAGRVHAKHPATPPIFVLTDAHGAAAQACRAAGDKPTFYLIGKDGGIKMARHGAPSAPELFGTLDAMPMRRTEMKRGR